MRTIKVILLICGLFPALCSAQVVQSGSIYAWGWNDYGQCDVPEPNSGFIATTGGDYHSLGLKADGSIVAWGANDFGQCYIPSPNTGFIAIAAGAYHSLYLKADGSIVAWGRNNYGQNSIPSPNSGFIAITTGDYHNLGLKADGSIVAWGTNDFGQCNVPTPNTDFIAIAAARYHSLGLKADGSIAAWGRNDFDQCNIPSPNTGFIAVAAGYYHSLGLKSNGSIVAWGKNDFGQCNIPSPNTGFIAVAAGYYHSLGLKSDGSIVAWGSNDNGQCNIPNPNTGFITIANWGGFHSLAIKGTPSYFQYQGMLVEHGMPVYGTYDLEFLLYVTPDDANLVTSPITIEDVNVIDGHYNVELNFGSDVFDGQPRWLEIWSRSASSNDEFVLTGKREKLSPVPYALYAQNSGNASGGNNESGSRNSLDAADGSPTEAVYVDNNGNVGIGTTSPSEKLDIYGTIKITGFKLPSGASNGYVLTSDGSGIGTWKALPTGSSGFTGSGSTNYFPKFTSSTTLGNSILFETGSKIGIGTTNPTTKFEVQGGAIKATGGLIIETRTSDPSNPETGRIWLRTDISPN